MLKTNKKLSVTDMRKLMESLGNLIAPLERQLQRTPNDAILSRELDRFKILYSDLQEQLLSQKQLSA